MYYNGGVILAIFAGATAGYFVSAVSLVESSMQEIDESEENLIVYIVQSDTVGGFEAPGVRGECCA